LRKSAQIWSVLNLTPKIFVLKLSEVIVGSEIQDPDPGSGKNLFRIPDPGVQKAPDSGSATLAGENIFKSGLASYEFG